MLRRYRLHRSRLSSNKSSPSSLSIEEIADETVGASLVPLMVIVTISGAEDAFVAPESSVATML